MKQKMKVVCTLGDAFQTKKKDGSGIRKVVLVDEKGVNHSHAVYDKDITKLVNITAGQVLEFEFNIAEMCYLG